MVEDRVTSGTRVAQLLASELTGLETGPLAEVSVVDADPDATPTPEGTEAYAVAHRGTRIGTVSVYPDCVRVRVRLTDVPSPERLSDVSQPDEGANIPVPVEAGDGVVDLWVEDGVAVKRAVDALRAMLYRPT